ncbi:MAG: hypothetical protein HY902_08475 [Deltaproteobacteria bacterium]|nr:hypothetical protein [Deltaproteobacteria bacterium]
MNPRSALVSFVLASWRCRAETLLLADGKQVSVRYGQRRKRGRFGYALGLGMQQVRLALGWRTTVALGDAAPGPRRCSTPGHGSDLA